MKKYELLKDTPDAKAGSVYEYREIYEYVISPNEKKVVPAGYYPVGFVFKGQEGFEYFSTDTIENKPEWFKEVFDNGITLTDRQAHIHYALEKFVDDLSVNRDGSISINRNKEYEIIKEIEGLLTEKTDHSVKKEVDNKFHVMTEDGIDCTDGDKIYGIAIQASGVDQWREQVLPFTSPIGESRKWFYSKERAAEYLIANKKCLSLDDLLSRINMGDVSRNHFVALIKERI